MKIRIVILFIFFFSLGLMSAFAQSSPYVRQGDTVKKKVPPQVYGNPKNKRRADSLAVIRKMQEIEREEKLRNQQIEAGDVIRMPKKKEDTVNIPDTLEKEVVIKMEVTEERKSASVWTLVQCIDYALQHNLQISEALLNERLAKWQVQQSKSARLPNVNADATLGDSYGRSIDPTSNQFVTKGFIYNSLGLNSQALVFGWFQKRYQIAQNQLDLKATYEANSQLRDDIALNIATGYLRVLLAREQIKIAEDRIKLDYQQYLQTEKFAKAGRIPELNVAQVLAQLSGDSATWVGALSEERLALLQLKALMNKEFDDPFDIETPSIGKIQPDALSRYPSAEVIWQTAMGSQHKMKFNQIKLASAKKALDIAKAVQYPQLSIFATLGTNYSSNFKKITGQNYEGEQQVGAINVGGIQYPITTPIYSYNTAIIPFLDQYNQNLRANIGFSLNIPILNGRSTYANIQRARIGVQSQQIRIESDQLKLKQDIYTAYEQARSASQKYQAAANALQSAETALDYAVKRYVVGMINVFEYTTVLNSFNSAGYNLLSTKYDLIFKMKVLDYYLGNPIKL